MGARQSKRSVDISGKEAEGAGEVAAAGAGGEGRVEQLADADALKPQLNGDAHIHEPTDKEKELDSGTPENEKDATTEKENKEQDEEKDKETTPVSNGDGEQKTESGDSATTPDDGKKPKKEKVKKKWSLRSISFSRKDKPKQEKKQKEEESKTNGEPEKVPEETAEASPEPAVNEETEEIKASIEDKDEKTPDTPVTEPITNGSSTPESPKLELPAVEESTTVLPEEPKVEVTPESVPELPINGLSLEEPKQDIPEIENKIEEIIGSKPEETPVETTEIVPVPEIPVKKEVCVEQVPLIEPTPPPLPANPPPSSVASFAATTMAPELTDASLSNTAETAVPSQPSAMDSKTSLNDNQSEPQTNLTNVTTVTDVLTLPPKEIVDEKNIDNLDQAEAKVILKTSDDTREINVENKMEDSNIETVHQEIVETNETIVAKVENKTVSENGTANKETGAASESEITPVIETIEAKDEIEENGTGSLKEIEPELKATEISQNDLEAKKIEQEETELLPEFVEGKCKEIEPSSMLPDRDETEDVSSVKEVDTEVKKQYSEVSEIKEDIPPTTSETNTNIEPPVVEENVNIEELPPPPPVMSDEFDTQNDAMDESNDTDTQEIIIPTSQIDSNIIESNMVTDNRDTEIINAENTDDNKVATDDNVNICKDPLGNVIETVECNGNIDNIDTVQELVEVASVTTPAEDKIILNPETEDETETPGVCMPPSLSVSVSECMPAAGGTDQSETSAEPHTPHTPHTPHAPQDPLLEEVCDKMSQLITDVSSPVPELKTEMETSSDVTVAN